MFILIFTYWPYFISDLLSEIISFFLKCMSFRSFYNESVLVVNSQFVIIWNNFLPPYFLKIAFLV